MDCKIIDVDVLCVTDSVAKKIPGGVELIGAPLEWPETKGEKIKVAVIDTGRPQHKDLKVVKSKNFSDESDDIDHNGHSTHVSGIICANGDLLGVAPNVELYIAKAMKNNGTGNWPWIINAIDWCIEEGVHVINMSLGGIDGSTSLHQAIKKAYDKGIIIVTAAGNAGQKEGQNTVKYPARYDECVATSAIDINKRLGSFSSSGPEVEIASPGVKVYSTYTNNRYAELQGTSMAAPHLSGAIALLQAKSLKRFGRFSTPEEIRYSLKLLAEDLGKPGPDEKFGYGVFSFGRFEKDETLYPFEDIDIFMKIGSDTYVVNKQEVKYQAPVLVNGRSLVPSRLVSESFGATVKWDSKDQSVRITGKRCLYKP